MPEFLAHVPAKKIYTMNLVKQDVILSVKLNNELVNVVIIQESGGQGLTH